MSPVEAAEAAIAADLAHADPAMWIFRAPDRGILGRARALEAEGARDRPLYGVTVAIKDNIDVAGMPTTAACPGFSYMPERNATAVQRLLDAGAIILGKTNLDQFATGLVGVRSPYGVPRNVFDPSRVPGGSSSGSATAVAAGIVEVALGTDTAGSGRVPAMFGNIVGLKPTVGSVPSTGMVPACRSIDTISIFAGSVGRALSVARVIGGYEASDPYSRAAPFAHLRRAALPPASRIACIDPAGCDPEVARLYAETAARFGAETIDIAPFLAVARLLYDGPWVAERTSALRHVLCAGTDLFPVTRTIIEGGLSRLTVDAFDAFDALAKARRIASDMFGKFDALLLPTAPFTPTLAELAADPIGPNSRLGTYTNFVNLCDLAAIAVPAGFSRDGLPVGVTVVGPAWSEGRIAAIADVIHRARVDRVGATSRALPATAEPDAIYGGETGLFCIGAHMSGLPLNGQITELGGRFVREATTVAEYRLFALGARPGLVRVGQALSRRREREQDSALTPPLPLAGEGRGEGAAIAGEIWALPASAIGPLLEKVPSPLGFGTVQLNTGPCLGFVAEAAATAGAPDITRYGGWRAYQTKMR